MQDQEFSNTSMDSPWVQDGFSEREDGLASKKFIKSGFFRWMAAFFVAASILTFIQADDACAFEGNSNLVAEQNADLENQGAERLRKIQVLIMERLQGARCILTPVHHLMEVLPIVSGVSLMKTDRPTMYWHLS